MDNNEVMKPIPEYPEYYATISGKIWSSKRNKFLKLYKDRDGYLNVSISNDYKISNFRVHRLVFEAFNGVIPKGLQVNHINEIKTDNRLENLNLMTAKENCNYGNRTAKQKNSISNTWKNSPENWLKARRKRMKTITIIDVASCGKYNFHGQVAASNHFDIRVSTLSNKIREARQHGTNRINLHGVEYIVKEA